MLSRASVPARMKGRTIGARNKLARALAQFGFFAPLTEDVFLDKGYGAASFTRATTATVVDHEGAIRNCLSGEVRFHGQRRVENVAGTFGNWATTGSGSLASCTSATGATDPQGGTTACTITATGPNASARDYSAASIYLGKSCRNSIWLRRRTGTGVVKLVEANNAGVGSSHDITAQLTTSWQRFAAPVTVLSTGYIYSGIYIVTSGDEVDIWHNQMEIVTGQSNQNPSEYVSNGAAKLNELRETENLGTSPWVLTNVTVSNGTTPEFAAAILKKVAATASAVTSLVQEHTATATSYCYTVYGKKDTGATDCNNFMVRNNTTPANLIAFTINWDTGAISHSIGSGATATDEGGGVWRITIPVSAGIVVGNTMRLYAGFNASAETANEAAYLGGAQAVPDTTTASTYFPVGNVYPFHGAMVDGVKYFSTLNGNTVASNVVTEATGAAITRPENDGLTNGLVLPGVAANYASIPDSVPTSITGDVDVRVKVYRDNWASGVDFTFLGKLQTAGQYAYDFYTTGLGNLYFRYSPDGTALRTATSSAATGLANGSTKWLRATYASATGKVNFYLSDDGASWTPLGTEQTLTAGAIFDGNTGIRIGTTNDPGNIIYRAIVKSGIDGTTVFDADFSAQALTTTTFTESSSNAATVTINRSGNSFAYIGNPARVTRPYGYASDAAGTNICLQSSNFGTTWTNQGTPTLSAAAAYCGEIALDLLGDDNAATAEAKLQAITFTGDAQKSVSFLVKQGSSTSSVVQLYDNTAPANRLVVAITWANGLPVCTYTTGSEERPPQALANGVWRIFCLSSSVTAANSHSLYFYPATTTAFAAANTGDVYFGGVQVQNLNVASPHHIPTVAGSVTVNADQLSYPCAGNIAEGTVSAYIENYCEAFYSNGRPLLFNAGGQRLLDMYWASATSLGVYMDGGYSDSGAAGNAPFQRAWQKFAAAITTNDAMKYLNGSAGTPDALLTPPTGNTTIDIARYGGGNQLNGLVRNARAAKTRVPDADLDLITT